VALSAGEIENAKYHLGYPGTRMAATIGLSMPTLVQTLYPVEGCLRELSEEFVTRVRGIMDVLDQHENQIVDAIKCRAKAVKVGNITLNEKEVERITKQCDFWARRLSNACGVVLGPYYQYGNGGGSGVNVAVMRNCG